MPIRPEDIERGAPVGRLDELRAVIGVALALLVAGALNYGAFGVADTTALVGPLGASALILFALPGSPFARPWAVIGGNALSAAVGLACGAAVPDPLYGGAVAVGLALFAMRRARCVHPPGGGMALIAAHGDPAVAAAGVLFPAAPVALCSAVLVFCAWTVRRAAAALRAERAPPQRVAENPPAGRAGFSTADLDAALARYDALIDVSREDLDALFRSVEAARGARLHGAISCGAVMTRDVITCAPDEPLADARARLLDNRLLLLPVVSPTGALLGVARHSDLRLGAGERVRDVMDRAPPTVGPETPVGELMLLLSRGGDRDAMVTAPDGRLVGLITQTDLLAVLLRSQLAEAGAERPAGLH